MKELLTFRILFMSYFLIYQLCCAFNTAVKQTFRIKLGKINGQYEVNFASDIPNDTIIRKQELTSSSWALQNNMVINWKR